MLRLVIGGISLGIEDLRGQTAAGRPQVAAAKSRSLAPPAGISPPHVLAGLAMGSIVGLSRVAGTAGKASAQLLNDLDRRLPPPMTKPFRAPARRAQSLLQRASDAGRREEARARALVEALVQEAVDGSVKDISERAIRDITHNADVADLVRAQSANLFSETLLDVRENSEHADDAVEKRVRSWLHLGGSASSGQQGRGSHNGRSAAS